MIERVVAYHNQLSECSGPEEKIEVLHRIALEDGGKDVVMHHTILCCPYPDVKLDMALRLVRDLQTTVAAGEVQTLEEARARAGGA